ncbi:MAG: methionine adenosyltransferase [Armatimonadota bacterium]
MQKYKLFTSESVTEGHPDKVADQVSDAILDAVLEQDPCGRVAVECLLTHGHAFIAGEVTTNADINFDQVARGAICDIGYTDSILGFDGNSCNMSVNIHKQSPHIACGVDIGGAGDQGMMFGYASRETDELMPLPITMAHEITRGLTDVRKSGVRSGFRPDGKAQVTIAYEDGEPRYIDTIVVSTQHDGGMTRNDVEQSVRKYVLDSLLDKYSAYLNDEMKLYVNPTGIFEIGGPQGDTGLTGRKIIVDTYGGMARHGGGCFSGKDPTKVDRSAAYMARQIAKSIVASDLADKCEIQLAYAIGVAEPVSVLIETFGTNRMNEDEIADLVMSRYDLTPKGIIDFLDLMRPIYNKTAQNGHFGHKEFPWERVGLLSDNMILLGNL